MLVNFYGARHCALGPLVLLGTLLGLSPVNAGPSAYDEAITRALRLLPRQPDKIEVVERDERSRVRSGTLPLEDVEEVEDVADVEAFVNRGGRVVYLVRQGVTLQATLKAPGIFDYALATENLARSALSCPVLREFGTSDHGPVVATFAD